MFPYLKARGFIYKTKRGGTAEGHSFRPHESCGLFMWKTREVVFKTKYNYLLQLIIINKEGFKCTEQSIK